MPVPGGGKPDFYGSVLDVASASIGALAVATNVTGPLFDTGGAVFNVKAAPFNAAGDGVTDDTAAIQKAIDAANALNPGSGPCYGATVTVPPGTFRFTQLKLYRGIWLKGAGPTATRFRLANQSKVTGAFILATVNEDRVSLSDFMLDGNSGAQSPRTVADGNITATLNVLTSATAAFTAADVGSTVVIAGANTAKNDLWTTITGLTNATTVTVADNAITTAAGVLTAIGVTDGILLDNTGTTGFQNGLPQSAHNVSNLIIQNFTGSNYHARGQGASAGNRLAFHYGIRAFNAGLHNWYLEATSDDLYDQCFSGGSGWEGWYLAGSTHQLNNCRSVTSGLGVQPTRGDGFFLAGGFKQRILTNCFSQSNQQHGYHLLAAGDILNGSVADSNGANLAGNNAGFTIDSGTDNFIVGLAVNNGISGGQQDYAIRVIGVANTLRNTINLGSVTPGTADSLGAWGGTNSIVVNGSNMLHLTSSAAGTPATSNLGANVTSATFTGNDTRGTIAIVMSGALAANTRVCTATFATSYGATAPKVTLVDQTSAVGITIVNSYVLSQSTGVSFDIAFDQALAAGTYTLDYIVIG